MDKMKIAFESFAECLTYMVVSLFVVVSAYLAGDIVPWWVCFAACIVVCLGMSWLNYMGKVYGYGFDEDEEDDDEEDDGE